MYKTCFECPHIKIKNRKGRHSFICPKLTKILGAYFFIDNAGDRPKICPLLKRNKRGKEEGKLKDNNGDGSIDREKLEKSKGEGEVNITEEIIKLYQNDPISHSVIQYLLNKYKIIPLNAVASIDRHREEILLNIVNVYKKMWDARGKIMLKAMQSGDKPMRIIIKERGKNESIQQEHTTKNSEKDGKIEGNNTKGKSRETLNKENSDKT